MEITEILKEANAIAESLNKLLKEEKDVTDAASNYAKNFSDNKTEFNELIDAYKAGYYYRQQKEIDDDNSKIESRLKILYEKLPDASKVEDKKCTPLQWMILGAYRELESLLEIENK